MCREEVTGIQKTEFTQNCLRRPARASIETSSQNLDRCAQRPRTIHHALNESNFLPSLRLVDGSTMLVFFWFSDHRCQAFHGESQRIFTLRASDVVEHIRSRQAREITAS